MFMFIHFVIEALLINYSSFFFLFYLISIEMQSLLAFWSKKLIFFLF